GTSMSELERSLTSLASAVEWPPTPHMQLRLRERRQRSVPRLAIALALFALALGVALAVPQARSAILRLFHLGGVTIVRVDTLPQAQDRALGVDLGMLVTRSEAERTLLGPVRVPPLRGAPRFHE